MLTLIDCVITLHTYPRIVTRILPTLAALTKGAISSPYCWIYHMSIYTTYIAIIPKDLTRAGQMSDCRQHTHGILEQCF